MATYSALRSVSETLTAGTVDVVNLTQPWDKILVTNHGSTEIWCRTDGVNPTSGGANNDLVVPADSFRIFYGYNPSATPGSTSNPFHQVRLIASADTPFTVEGLKGG